MFRTNNSKPSNGTALGLRPARSVGRVEIKAETNSPGEGNRRRRFVPKAEFTVYETGALVRGPCYIPRARANGEDNSDQTPEFILNDSRATALNVGFVQGRFFCGASLERFSGHTGVCRVLGSKKLTCVPHSLKLGDLLRFGSVGLVVCELHRGLDGGEVEALSEEEIARLKLHYLSVPQGDGTQDGNNQKDQYGSDDEHDESESSNDEENTTTNHERARNAIFGEPGSEKFCYICYDGEVDDLNPLVSPCLCKGDTKYVHLACLQRWNNNDDANGARPKVCVVTNTAGVDLCSVCKTPYKTSVRLENGKVVSLLAAKLPPPYVTFAVVTRHEVRSRTTALTNTQFQLSFSSFSNPNGATLSIGRSTSNDMVLRYRTVSQLHAKVKYQNGQFWLHDVSSSNGTMLFLNKPLELEYGKPVHVKMGRTVMTMKAKKRWRWSFADSTAPQRVGETLDENIPSAAPLANSNAMLSPLQVAPTPRQRNSSTDSAGHVREDAWIFI